MSQYDDRKRGAQDDSGLPPPSYTEATLSGSQANPIVPKGDPLQDSLEQLLQRLPIQLRASQQDQLGQQQDDECLLVERCTPYIAEFFHAIPITLLSSQYHQQHLLAELILSPANAVPATQGWVLSDWDQRRENAACVQVVEVDLSEKKKPETPDRKIPGAFAESLWEDRKDLMWWRGEDLAHRLASRIRRCLEPEGKTESKTRASAGIKADSGLHNEGSPRHEGYAQKHKSPSSLFSGHGKKSHALTSSRGLGSHSHGGSLMGTANRDLEGVKVNVQAEEVTYRRENDMGLWESSTGWAIVLIVTVTP